MAQVDGKAGESPEVEEDKGEAEREGQEKSSEPEENEEEHQEDRCWCLSSCARQPFSFSAFCRCFDERSQPQLPWSPQAATSACLRFGVWGAQDVSAHF